MPTTTKYPTHKAMAQRLAYRYRKSTAEHRAHGYHWYLAANALCRRVGAEYGLSLEAVAGAVAALSPQVSWADQERFLPAFVASVLAGHDTLPHPGFRKNRARAAAILLGARPLAILGGKKVRAFYGCLIDPTGCPVPCIDRHAASAALGRKIDAIPHVLFGRMVDAYRLAAAWCEIPVPEFQATLWVLERERKGH